MENAVFGIVFVNAENDKNITSAPHYIGFWREMLYILYLFINIFLNP